MNFFKIFYLFFKKNQNPEEQVAIKQITKKQLSKSQSLLEKEIKILKVKKNVIASFLILFKNLGINKT